MRVRILTIGSEGDVRPYVAFGAALSKAGHDVRIASHVGFESLVRANGLDFAPVAGDPREMTENAQLRELHDNGRNPVQWWRTFNEVDAPLMRERLRDCWRACEDAEAIVVSVLPYLFGYAIARKLQVPLVRAFYFPTSPTRTYAAEFIPRWMQRSESINLASFALQRQVLWQVARPWIASACREVLGQNLFPYLEPFGALDREQQLLLYCYSPHVSPPPCDWGSWIAVTGYWFLDRTTDWRPSHDLIRFLENGPPPIYVGGFGGMTNRNPADFVEAVKQALASTGQRAIVLKGWGGLAGADPGGDLFVTEWVPFDWLFNRVSAVVHHGGAGTTAASLRAGVPTIVIPFFLDQFYWGRRVFELGVGPRPILRKHLTADNLANAMRQAVSDSAMRHRAVALGERIRAEDGLAQAVAAFEAHVGRSRK